MKFTFGEYVEVDDVPHDSLLLYNGQLYGKESSGTFGIGPGKVHLHGLQRAIYLGSMEDFLEIIQKQLEAKK